MVDQKVKINHAYNCMNTSGLVPAAWGIEITGIAWVNGVETVACIGFGFWWQVFKANYKIKLLIVDN